MKAMILAAGKGTRLGSLTESVPKALIDINGKSVLHIAVEKCTEAGFDDILINVHHFADQVEKETEFLIRMGYKITVSDERDQLLETGGGLYKARNFFVSSPFLLYNVDILSDIDLSRFFAFHKKRNGIATIAVRNRSGNRYFLVDRNDRLSGWCNHATGERLITCNKDTVLSEIAFSGLHIIEPEIFKYMSAGVYTMTKLYLDLATERNIYAFRADDGYWFDIGTPENLEEARKFLKTSQQ
jgi:NDP-sugar pyrophosphorylase family protein